MTDPMADIRFHWDEAFNFTMVGEQWCATSKTDPALVLLADSEDELRLLIRREYKPGTRPFEGPCDQGSL